MGALKELSEKGASGIAGYFQSFILTGSRDKLIKLFLAQTGELLHTFTGHDNWVRSLSLHATGKYLYSSSDDKTVKVWDLNFGKEKKTVPAHEHFVAVVKYNPKYAVIASAGNDLALKIWNLK
jgi:platelet-activating factor acetylhydrolase IB subunit alpha